MMKSMRGRGHFDFGLGILDFRLGKDWKEEGTKEGAGGRVEVNIFQNESCSENLKDGYLYTVFCGLFFSYYIMCS